MSSLLSLPLEIRYMIYENLHITTHHHTLTFRTSQPDDFAYVDVTLVSQSLPLALLRTCKQFHSEASPYFEPHLQKMKNEPIKFIVNAERFREWDHKSLRHQVTPLFPAASQTGIEILRLWRDSTPAALLRTQLDAYSAWLDFRCFQQVPDINIAITGHPTTFQKTCVPHLVRQLDLYLRQRGRFGECNMSIAPGAFRRSVTKEFARHRNYLAYLEGKFAHIWHVRTIRPVLQPTVEEWEVEWEEGKRVLGKWYEDSAA